MNKNPNDDTEMLDEYDFSAGVRGKYTERAVDSTHVIVLEPDVADVFCDSESVNKALRGLLPVIREQAGRVERR